jgi:hypothetical protein
MNCPYCSQEMKATDTPSLYTCTGASWSPHDPLDWDDAGKAYQTTSLTIAQWFRDNGFTVTPMGTAYQIKQKKGILQRLFS